VDEFRTTVRIMESPSRSEREAVEAFLGRLDLSLEDDIELCAVMEEDGAIVATGSLSGDILKCIGVRPDRDGEGLANRVVGQLVAAAASLERFHLFVYTKPSNEYLFSRMGFRLLASSGADSILMENSPRGIESYLAGVKARIPGGMADGAIVVNCNPFTLGHRYLLERAAAASEFLVVFVLSGERSVFPQSVRESLVRAGTAELGNVRVVPGSSYCISGATFPSYFIKEKSRSTSIQARLDLELFARRIAPALGITKRFVGTEPFCEVTSTYNSVMAEVLPRNGIRLVEIPRLESGGLAISASAVRKALRDSDLAAVRNMVPRTTWDWLHSPEAAPVLAKLRSGQSRH
jgi:[citrate (pro-3S)-lyase] ligase